MDPRTERADRQGLHPGADDLVALLDGELTDDERAATTRHLEQCWACRRDLHALQRAIDTVVELAQLPLVGDDDRGVGSGPAGRDGNETASASCSGDPSGVRLQFVARLREHASLDTTAHRRTRLMPLGAVGVAAVLLLVVGPADAWSASVRLARAAAATMVSAGTAISRWMGTEHPRHEAASASPAASGDSSSGRAGRASDAASVGPVTATGGESGRDARATRTWRPPMPLRYDAAPITTIEAVSARVLHDHALCLGGEVYIFPMSDGSILVQGVMDAAPARDRLMRELRREAPAVSLDVHVADETPRAIALFDSPFGRGPSVGPNRLLAPQVQVLGASASTIPAYARLHEAFAAEVRSDDGASGEDAPEDVIARRIGDFTNDTLTLSRNVLLHAWALRRHVDEFAATRSGGWTEETRHTVATMIRAHEQFLHAAADDLRTRARRFASPTHVEASSPSDRAGGESPAATAPPLAMVRGGVPARAHETASAWLDAALDQHARVGALLSRSDTGGTTDNVDAVATQLAAALARLP